MPTSPRITTMADAVVHCAPDGAVTGFSATAPSVLEMTPEGLLAASLGEVIPAAALSGTDLDAVLDHVRADGALHLAPPPDVEDAVLAAVVHAVHDADGLTGYTLYLRPTDLPSLDAASGDGQTPTGQGPPDAARNGFAPDRPSSNGTALNGTALNGTALNGTVLNGTSADPSSSSDRGMPSRPDGAAGASVLSDALAQFDLGLTLDAEGSVLWMADTWDALLDREECLGCPFQDLLSSDSAQSVPTLLKSAQSSSAPFPVRLSLNTEQGLPVSLCGFLGSANPPSDAQPEAPGCPAVRGWFLPKERLTNSTPDAADRQFRLIAESLDAVFYLSDLRDSTPSIQYVSPGYESLWQRSRADLYDDPRAFLRPVHPHDRPRLEHALERQLQGETTDLEYRLLHDDGSIRWMRDRSVPILTRDGKVYRVAGMVQDVTEEHRAKRALERRSELESLIASIALHFSSSDAADLDDEIHRALRSVGRFFNAERCYVLLARDEGRRLERTHLWSRDGTTERDAQTRITDRDDYPWFTRQLDRGQPIIIRDVDDLPPEADAERALIESFDIRCIINVPMRRNGRFVGIVGLNFNSADALDIDAIDMLQILGELVAGALEQRDKTRALHESRERYRRLIEGGRDVVFELDESGIIQYVSPAIVHTTGYFPDEVIGTSILEYMVEDDTRLAPLLDPSSDVDESGLEYRIRDRSGNMHFLRVSARVIQSDTAGVRISGIATDITARKQAEIALRSEKLFTEQALDSLPGIFYLVNHNLRIKRWNQNLETALGVTATEVTGCRFTELFNFSVRPAINDALKQAFLGHTTRFEANVTAAGEGTRHVFTAAPVDINGERFVVGMGIDISKRIVAQRRLAESFEALRQMHSISVDDEAPTLAKIVRLLKSGRDYLGTTGAALSYVDGDQYTIEAAVGTPMPPPGTTFTLQETLCDILLSRPAYEWPLTVSRTGIDRPLRFPPTRNDEADTVTYIGMPVLVDGEIYGTLTFSGPTDVEHALTAEEQEYVKLVAQWIATALSRDEARRAVASSEQRFRELFEAAPDAYVVVDPADGTITDCNDALSDLVGRPREQLVSRTVARLYPTDPDNLLASPTQWAREVITRRTWRASDIPVLDADGTERVVDVSASRVDLDSGPHVLAVLRDVTQRKETQRQLQRAVTRNRDFADDLQRLIRVSTALETHLDPTIVAERIVAGTVDVIRGAEAASLWMFDDDHARVLANNGHNAVLTGLKVPLRDGILARLARGNGPQVVRDVLRNRQTILELDDVTASPRSVLGVPVLVDGAMRGALLAENYSRAAAFEAREQDLLRTLASQAGVTLTNAQAVVELRDMSHRLLQAQEEERQYIAQELHDQTGGLLTSLQFKLQDVEDSLHTDDDPLGVLEEARTMVVSLSELLRRVSRSLRPRILDDLGLHAALPWLVNEMQSQFDLEFTLHSDVPHSRRFPEMVETACFRIVQEALTNVARYARAESAQVLVQLTDDVLRVHVIDDGVGFDAAAKLSTTTTLGLRGMMERAERLGGSFEVDSEPNEGTRITARLPVTLDE